LFHDFIEAAEKYIGRSGSKGKLLDDVHGFGRVKLIIAVSLHALDNLEVLFRKVVIDCKLVAFFPELEPRLFYQQQLLGFK
jgi:hypothetical protein